VSGMTMVIMLVDSKAESPIEVTVDGMVTVFSEEHSNRALTGMLVTSLAMVI
jgi:hypothetical protein